MKTVWVENAGVFIWEKFGSSQTFSRINTPTFLNLVIFLSYLPIKMGQSVSKRRHIKFRGRGITQKKQYNFQNTAEIWNQESNYLLKFTSSHGIMSRNASFSYKNLLTRHRYCNWTIVRSSVFQVCYCFAVSKVHEECERGPKIDYTHTHTHTLEILPRLPKS